MRSTLFRSLLILSMAFSLPACNNGGSGGGSVSTPSGVTAPTALSYAASPVLAQVGVALSMLSSTVTGAVDTYSVNPSLPAGTSLDGTTGDITGTPTVASPATAYTITATNAGGSTTIDLTITVRDAAPSNLSYASPQSLPTGVAIAPLSPTVTGNVTGYSVAPPLPTGLALDPSVGTISGTPTVVTPAATFTVAATGPGGTTTFDLSLSVFAVTVGAPILSLDFDVKQLLLSWTAVAGATSYRVFEDPEGDSTFVQSGGDLSPGTTDASIGISAHRLDYDAAQYFVEACDGSTCTESNTVSVGGFNLASSATVGFFKASNAELNDDLRSPVISADGMTFAVLALSEDSDATGINGDQTNNNAFNLGTRAIYIFRNTGGVWSQEAYIKPPAITAFDRFGESMSLSGDGSTLAVGSSQEDSGSIGIGGDPNDDSGPANSGAVHIYRRSGSNWALEEFIKASNPGVGDFFGKSASLSDDGNTLVVGAFRESSADTGPGADESSDQAPNAGAAYVFVRTGSTWRQETYLKASNTDAGDEFGFAARISGDGNTIAIGADFEASNAVGIGGDETNNSANATGAIYVFVRSGATWEQQAYIKASNSRDGLQLGIGNAIDFSFDGNTMVVGAFKENSDSQGINGDETTPAQFSSSGAAYLFVRNGVTWTQQAFIKASNARFSDNFGNSVGLSSDGNTLIVGAFGEDSTATGFDGDESDDSRESTGAAYLFDRTGTTWTQSRYIKAPQVVDLRDRFARDVDISGDGGTLVISSQDDSAVIPGSNSGSQPDNTVEDTGAVFVY